jgi:hypothetical protein
MVTIDTENLYLAPRRKILTICPLKARQQGYHPFLDCLAQPLQFGLLASEPVQGMEVARRHVIPSCQDVPSTDCRVGTIG